MIYFLNPVAHPNIGDIAIFYASCKLLQDACIEFKILNKENYDKLEIQFNDKLLVLGGGWIGLYSDDCTNFYYNTILKFSKNGNKVIIMPNSFVPNNKDFTKISNLPLTIFARDMESFKQYKEYFKESKILLCPDIVFYLERINVTTGKGKCAYIRNDFEGTKLIANFSYDCIDGRFTKQPVFYQPDNNNVYDTIMRQLFKMSKYQLIITDTLHMSIFAYLLKKPCLYFDTKFKKIGNTWKQYKQLNCNEFVSDKNFDISKYEFNYEDGDFNFNELLSELKTN